jgi:hypothetical protein
MEQRHERYPPEPRQYLSTATPSLELRSQSEMHHLRTLNYEWSHLFAL